MHTERIHTLPPSGVVVASARNEPHRENLLSVPRGSLYSTVRQLTARSATTGQLAHNSCKTGQGVKRLENQASK